MQSVHALAKKCVTDGEKVTKFVKVKVKRAPDTDSALKVARSISNSTLVKSSWYGSVQDTRGRIIDAAGYAKVGIKFDQLSLNYNDCPALEGKPMVQNKARWKEIVSSKEFSIILDLNMGSSEGEIWSNDLSEEYVNFNKKRIMPEIERELEKKRAFLSKLFPMLEDFVDPHL